MSRNVYNSENILDIREIIEKFEELEQELTDAKDGQSEQAEGMDLDEWIEGLDAAKHPFQETIEEYELLSELLDDLRGNGVGHDWRGNWYPATLVRDSHFKEYAEDLAGDLGYVDLNVRWPYTCIDWKEAAEELKQDYSTVDFGDVTYWHQ